MSEAKTEVKYCHENAAALSKIKHTATLYSVDMRLGSSEEGLDDLLSRSKLEPPFFLGWLISF